MTSPCWKSKKRKFSEGGIKPLPTTVLFRDKNQEIWSRCAANFHKVPKCAVGEKRFRTTALVNQRCCYFSCFLILYKPRFLAVRHSQQFLLKKLAKKFLKKTIFLKTTKIERLYGPVNTIGNFM